MKEILNSLAEATVTAALMAVGVWALGSDKFSALMLIFIFFEIKKGNAKKEK